MFGRRRKLKREYDQRLKSLMLETKEEWIQSKSLEKHLDDYDLEVFIQRKIAESKHFYLYKEAKMRKLGSD